MKPLIFTGQEQGLLPWCPLKAYMIWIQIAQILLKLALFLWAGKRLQLVCSLHGLAEKTGFSLQYYANTKKYSIVQMLRLFLDMMLGK